jgi:hypothetical protein
MSARDWTNEWAEYQTTGVLGFASPAERADWDDWVRRHKVDQGLHSLASKQEGALTGTRCPACGRFSMTAGHVAGYTGQRGCLECQAPGMDL